MSPAYADDVLTEARRPYGEGQLALPCRSARAANPLCGDEIALDVADDGVRVVAVAHRTRGCVYTRASASLLARVIEGASIADANELGAALRRDLATSSPLPAEVAVLASVRVYPARLRCALLPWEALRLALGDA